MIVYVPKCCKECAVTCSATRKDEVCKNCPKKCCQKKVAVNSAWTGASQDDYDRAADFAKPRHDWMTVDTLKMVRVALFVLHLIQCLNIFTMDERPWTLAFYLSEWGVWWSMFATLASIKAATYADWQKTAMITMQFAACLDLLITPVFWFYLVPGMGVQDPAMKWSAYKADPAIPWPIALYNVLLQIFHHSLPVISVMTNLYLTDMEFIPKDWKLMLLLGLSYIPCEYYGWVTLT